MISGILLAAGAGRRFGGQKLLEDLGGKPMVARTAAACLSSRLDEIIVVTAPDGRVAEVLRANFPGEPRLCYVANPDPERGLMSSLKTGLGSVSARSVAAMVIHGDMPMVPPNLIDELVIEQAWHGGIVIPVSGDEWRHPRIIPSGLFEEFLALTDDARGTTVIDRYRADVTTVSVGGTDTFLDIDVPSDVDTWRAANQLEL
jgi:molybdenum cofactor cytidylyltransferase